MYLFSVNLKITNEPCKKTSIPLKASVNVFGQMNKNIIILFQGTI